MCVCVCVCVSVGLSPTCSTTPDDVVSCGSKYLHTLACQWSSGSCLLSANLCGLQSGWCSPARCPPRTNMSGWMNPGASNLVLFPFGGIVSLWLLMGVFIFSSLEGYWWLSVGLHVWINSYILETALSLLFYCYSFFGSFFLGMVVIMGLEFRTSCLLGGCSITWTMHLFLDKWKEPVYVDWFVHVLGMGMFTKMMSLSHLCNWSAIKTTHLEF
jgi:hypothetical protein